MTVQELVIESARDTARGVYWRREGLARWAANQPDHSFGHWFARTNMHVLFASPASCHALVAAAPIDHDR
jgi:hypothetical protein